MKNFSVIFFCVFLPLGFYSFENVNKIFFPHEINLFTSQERILRFPNPLDSSEPADTSGGGDQPVDYGVTDIANMFNERGFYKSNGFSFDENEIINDFNGNLIYNIPLYNYPLAGDLSFNMALTYNGSVGHQFILGTVTEYNNFPQRYNMNAPEWIISVNGIAIQVLNFETNFFTTKSSDPNIHYINDDSVKLLIPGYHFDGSLEAAGSGNPNRINILAGDGSVISLVRISTETETDSLYVGDYVYEGKELYYRAKVSYIETGGYTGFRRRKVELLKGDGTVCTFIEHKRVFADLPIDANITARKNQCYYCLNQSQIDSDIKLILNIHLVFRLTEDLC